MSFRNEPSADNERVFNRLSHFIHRRFIWLLIGSYLLAAVFPSPGLQIKNAARGGVNLPMVVLAFLLFNAGLAVELPQLKQIRHKPAALLAGLVANLLIPIFFIGVVTLVMRHWHNGDEVQNILVGLALVASMPIAGSSTAWSQNASGNLALSLGLVLLSTSLSPLTTPLALHSVGLMTTGDYSEDLHELAGATTGWFLTVSVVLPSLLGIAINRFAPGVRTGSVKSILKLANSFVLLILNYSNASVSLPQALADPDPDFLFAILAVTVALCIVAFACGGLIARALKSNHADRASLMFGLGMNNNGTGLVLASMAMSDHPRVMLPIIFYNLIQHLAAACVDAWIV